MTRKRTYTSRIADICQKAKQETIDILKANNVRSVILKPGSVMLISTDKNGDLKEYSVTKVYISDNGLGDVLEFSCGAEGYWYANSILWGEICDAVRSIFNVR